MNLQNFNNTLLAQLISIQNLFISYLSRIYGAGQNFAQSLLKQFNPTMSDAEARSKAQKMFKLTKGGRYYYLRPGYLTEFPNKRYTKWQAFEIAKGYGRTIDEVFLMSR